MDKNKQTNDLWGGRFSESTDEFVQAFTASVQFDQRMATQDIRCSIAHAKMLGRCGILSDVDVDKILAGLEQVSEEIASGKFEWSIALEDVHMNIEANLTARIGDAGKRLHTGRSRNDQVATDIRLYMRESIAAVIKEAKRLQLGMLDLAERHHDMIMPGFTHLQTAQPVTFGHHVMAWFEMISRDIERMQQCAERLNVMPLGAAALAGTTAAITMTHLSRISEELVLWSSAQFDFVELPDRFCTGSSIMPQKKNPDVPELVRGKTGRVNGHLISLLTLMKSQPLAYNKDNQEDKEPLFDTLDTLMGCLRAFADMIPAIEPKEDNMREAAKKGFATATDLADYLVKRGMPFRDSHEVVGKAVAYGIEKGRDLAEMSLTELQKFSSDIDDEVFEVLTLDGSVAARDHVGGTAPAQVLAAIGRARAALVIEE